MDTRTRFLHHLFAAVVVASSCLGVTAAEASIYSTLSRLWTAQTGTVNSDFGRGVAVDGSDNGYVVGYTSGSFTGFTNAGEADMFLIKYGPSGNVLWPTQLGTTANDQGFAVAVDSAGSAYVCGSTYGSLPGQTNAGGADLFLAKYDPAGVRQWIVQLGSAQNDEAFALVVNSTGVYVAGYTSGKLGLTANAGGKDIFLMKFDLSGTPLWVRQDGTAADEVTHGIAVDPSGNVYVTGYTSGTLTGSGNAGFADIFLMKLDATGILQWASQFGTAGDDIAFAVAASTDQVIISGVTGGGLDGSTRIGAADAFLTSYSLAGIRQWTRQFGTPQDDEATGVSLTSGTVCIAGATMGGMDGAVNAGSWDVFVTTFDVSGNRGTAKQMGTTASDRAQGIAADSSGNPLTAGYTAGNFDGYTSIGKEDVILVKFRLTVVPFLWWTGENGYTDNGVQPRENTGEGTFSYHVAYDDDDNIAPLAGYPKVHVKRDGAEIAGSPFLMTSTLPGTTTFSFGVIYTASVALPAGTFSYFFEAYDALGNKAIGTPTTETMGPVYRMPEVQNVQIFHGVFKAGEGETCTISYTLDRGGEVGITIYDSLGRKVRSLFRGAASSGVNTAVWNGRDDSGSPVASGVYVFRFDPGGGKMKKAVVIR